MESYDESDDLMINVIVKELRYPNDNRTKK